MKRLLAMLLCSVLVLTAIPSTDFGAETVSGGSVVSQNKANEEADSNEDENNTYDVKVVSEKGKDSENRGESEDRGELGTEIVTEEDTTLYTGRSYEESVNKEVGEHPVTFNANGGLFDNGKTTYTYDLGQHTGYYVECRRVYPFRTGYKVIGWSKTINGSVDYKWSELFPFNFDEDLTLYAVWEEAVKITLNPNGGKIYNNILGDKVDKESFSI
ncbi:MAG: InlB B-repeat-containing protein [Lachnospiraceae bacterium]|nr:InlB B-repeat-containing protein [Lachnospiraceae bacterium]